MGSPEDGSAWRPFHVVKNAPLVVTDCRTVKANDLLEVDKVLPDKIEKAYYVIHRPYHKWYWMSDQTPDEPALFKTWTSSCDGVLAGVYFFLPYSFSRE